MNIVLVSASTSSPTRRTDQMLTIHDSFIVPVGSEERLNEVMRGAFNQVTGKDLSGPIQSEPDQKTALTF